MNPRELMGTVDALLTGERPSMRRCWPRACAALLRVALEQMLRHYWQHRAPSVAKAPMRSQLLILPTFAGEDAAGTARGAWNGLSRAVHHHAYELPATAEELRGWYDDLVRLLRTLERATGGGEPGDPQAHPDRRLRSAVERAGLDG